MLQLARSTVLCQEIFGCWCPLTWLFLPDRHMALQLVMFKGILLGQPWRAEVLAVS